MWLRPAATTSEQESQGQSQSALAAFGSDAEIYVLVEPRTVLMLSLYFCSVN